jgi:hypothetical protein
MGQKNGTEKIDVVNLSEMLGPGWGLVQTLV